MQRDEKENVMSHLHCNCAQCARCEQPKLHRPWIAIMMINVDPNDDSSSCTPVQSFVGTQIGVRNGRVPLICAARYCRSNAPIPPEAIHGLRHFGQNSRGQ
jgi:hypothetical protein